MQQVASAAQTVAAQVLQVEGSAAPVVQVSCGTGGVAVDAVKMADDGSGDLIVRVHESCGNRASVDVRARRRIIEAWRCNLLEEPDQGEEAGDGIVSVTLRPFQLLTLRLRMTE